VLPILSVKHLPLVDYPNHLGRFQIYVDLPNSPSLQAFYQWQWGIIPNLAVDILVIPFTWILPVEPAANTVILLSFLVTMAGTMFLDRQLNGPAWGLSVFTGLVLYSGAFRYGFVNYTITAGFAVFAFGLWVRYRDRVLGLTVALGLWAGVLRVYSRMVLPLGILAVLFLAIPRTLFNSNYADFRLPYGVTFFALASLRLQPTSGAKGRLILGILTVCLVVRIGSLLANWLPSQPILAEYEHALDQVPPGAKVLALMGRLGSASANRSPSLEHVPVFAGARRGALVPYTFTHEATPIRLRPEYQSYWTFDPRPETAADMARYDYVLFLHKPDITIPPGVVRLDRIGQGKAYTLFRVIRPSSG
jgi:hypothetical protein